MTDEQLALSAVDWQAIAALAKDLNAVFIGVTRQPWRLSDDDDERFRTIGSDHRRRRAYRVGMLIRRVAGEQGQQQRNFLYVTHSDPRQPGDLVALDEAVAP